jgi:hypothetical protein
MATSLALKANGCAKLSWSQLGKSGKLLKLTPIIQGGIAMQAVQFQATTPLQRFVMEKALAFAQELETLTNAAPDGQVLDVAEGAVLGQGREFLRETLQVCLQAQAEAAEKKGRRSDAVVAVSGGTAKGKCRGSY